jgi:hypothetical protein
MYYSTKSSNSSSGHTVFPTEFRNSRYEQSSSLLLATSQHDHSWHRAPLGPMDIYFFNVKIFFFFFRCSSFDRKGGVGLFFIIGVPLLHPFPYSRLSSWHGPHRIHVSRVRLRIHWSVTSIRYGMEDMENTASYIVACWTVFTELLPGNALIKFYYSIILSYMPVSRKWLNYIKFSNQSLSAFFISSMHE